MMVTRAPGYVPNHLYCPYGNITEEKVAETVFYHEPSHSPTELRLETCSHSPQCILREPRPTPFGPKTLKQSETESEIIKNEAVQTFMEHVRKFMN